MSGTTTYDGATDASIEWQWGPSDFLDVDGILCTVTPECQTLGTAIWNGEIWEGDAACQRHSEAVGLDWESWK